MIKSCGLTLLCIATLTGCATLAPESENLDIAALPDYVGTTTPAAANLSQLGWQQFFNDPQLIQLITVALANNTDLKLALLKTEESRKDYGITQADSYPQLNGQASVSYAGENRNQTSKNYSSALNASVELDFFGRLHHLSQAQLARYLATQQAQRNVHLLLVAQVAKTYVNEQILRQNITLVKTQMTHYQHALTLVASRLVSGESTYLDYEQAKGLIESAALTLADLTEQRELALHTLQNLLHRYDVSVATVTEPLRLHVAMPANIPSTALLHRPDIQQAEYQLAAARADVSVARAAFFPAITLTGTVGNASTDLIDLLSGATLWELLPKLTLTIFNGKQNQLNLEVAQLRKQQAVVDYEKALHGAFKEVADLLTKAESYRNQVTLQRRYLATQHRAAELANAGYLAGTTSYLSVLTAQQNRLASTLALQNLTQQHLANYIDLFVALGGGWQEDTL